MSFGRAAARTLCFAAALSLAGQGVAFGQGAFPRSALEPSAYTGHAGAARPPVALAVAATPRPANWNWRTVPDIGGVARPPATQFPGASSDTRSERPASAGATPFPRPLLGGSSAHSVRRR